MIRLEDITVLNDLRDRIEKISPYELEMADRKVNAGLSAKLDEKVVGEVTSLSTKALWALYILLSAEHLTAKAASIMLVDETRERDLKEQAAVLDMFADIAKEVFWAQAKMDVGFQQEKSVSLRSGWQIVELKTPENPLARILQLGPFGGDSGGE